MLPGGSKSRRKELFAAFLFLIGGLKDVAKSKWRRGGLVTTGVSRYAKRRGLVDGMQLCTELGGPGRERSKEMSIVGAVEIGTSAN